MKIHLEFELLVSQTKQVLQGVQVLQKKTPPFSTLILVRHGQSEWNLQNRFTGWVDVPLTPKGETEAHEAGQKIAKLQVQIDCAFTSALQRAQKTLEIILKELKQSPRQWQSDRLNERHYGDLQGKNKKETAELFGEEQVHQWRRSYDIAPPQGESLKDTKDRVMPYYTKEILPKILEGQIILIVAHGNSLRSLIMHLEGLTPEQILKRELDTGVPLLYQLSIENQKIAIKEKKIL